jgi:uncharacterized membrane protein YeaQ/YmgE (transglycosylase-associated protein family)
MRAIGTGIEILLLIIAISVAARKGSTTGRGVLYGILTGIVGSFLLNAIGGFLVLYLNIAQLDFYLVVWLHKFGLADYLNLWGQYSRK